MRKNQQILHSAPMKTIGTETQDLTTRNFPNLTQGTDVREEMNMNSRANALALGGSLRTPKHPRPQLTDEGQRRIEAVNALRVKHGWQPLRSGRRGASRWSKSVLASAATRQVRVSRNETHEAVVEVRMPTEAAPDRWVRAQLAPGFEWVTEGVDGEPIVKPVVCGTCATRNPDTGEAEQVLFPVPVQLTAEMTYRGQPLIPGGVLHTADGTLVPKNALLLDMLVERLRELGFAWHMRGHGDVRFTNYPTVCGMRPPLLELLTMPLELFDTPDEHLIEFGTKATGTHVEFNAQRARANATGIGYMGLDGISWRSTPEPFVLPAAFGEQLTKLGAAIFLLGDAAYALFGSDAELTTLLTYKVPDWVPKLVEKGRVEVIRPDIVVVREAGGVFRPVVTEIEGCPAGHGMQHALERCYGLPTQMADTLVQWLGGRSYRIMFRHEWAEYIFEQATICAELRKRGVDARVIVDRPLAEVEKIAQTRWKVRKEAGDDVRKRWRPEVIARLRERGWDEFVNGYLPNELPADLGNAVVWRFGYTTNFAKDGRTTLDLMAKWVQDGATVVNPLQFFLESKVLLAAIGVKAVRDWIAARDPEALDVLDRCVAKTWLLAPGFVDVAALKGSDISQPANRPHAISKFAGFDPHDQSWGARSLVVGSQTTIDEWERTIDGRLALPHPVVVQHTIRSVRVNTGWIDSDNFVQTDYRAGTRLTPFFVRMADGQAQHAGSMITLRSGSFRVHGALDAAETPVIYRG